MKFFILIFIFFLVFFYIRGLIKRLFTITTQVREQNKVDDFESEKNISDRARVLKKED